MHPQTRPIGGAKHAERELWWSDRQPGITSIERVRRLVASKEAPIAVVGLGYVGLPLACLLAREFSVVGLDINERRVEELQQGVDRTREVEDAAALQHDDITFTSDFDELTQAPLIIVAVPTPVDDGKVPDLRPLISASKMIGQYMQRGAVVVFESTVYPGVTESICGKHLSEVSGLELGRDFFLGYSPERVNPGDKLHTIDKSVKIVAGQTPAVTDLLAGVYGRVVSAGVHRASSIAAAEAAKVIENTQRDLNIALVNELAMLFDRIGLDTHDVLESARTKYNFMDVRPGLVGGHCIGVDPYYLAYLADSVGYCPQLIRASRSINDNMSSFIAHKVLGLMLAGPDGPSGRLRACILGVSFKEDVPDLRNSKVPAIAEALERFGVEVHIFDPVVDAEEFEHEYGRRLAAWDDVPECDALVLAVRHRVLLDELPMDRMARKLRGQRVLVDVKGVLDRDEARRQGINIWRP